MDRKKTINVSTLAPPKGPISHATAFNGTLYISGQLGMDSKTGKLAESVEDQTHQALSNMGEILRSAGLDFSDVLKVIVLLADMKDYAVVNKVYQSFFKRPFPARMCYQVANLPAGGKVEIDAIAAIQPKAKL